MIQLGSDDNQKIQLFSH